MQHTKMCKHLELCLTKTKKNKINKMLIKKDIIKQTNGLKFFKSHNLDSNSALKPCFLELLKTVCQLGIIIQHMHQPLTALVTD